MASALADAFRAEIPCTEAEADTLAALAHRHLPRLVGTSEDSEADLVLRLRDPRVFGAFAELVERDPRTSTALRRALLEHVFDLLPLPRSEAELIAVETRAPRHLLALAAALAAEGDLTVLHVMHLVYAVFLDKTLVMAVPRRARSAVLRAILASGGGGDRLRVLYAGLHLAAVPEPEAEAETRWVLTSTMTPLALRRSLASLGGAEDGGHATLTQMAQREGLLPEELDDPGGPAILANIPRLPERLAAACRAYLEHPESA